MYPEHFQTVCLGILPKPKPPCIAGIHQEYREQMKLSILYWIWGLLGVSDYLVSSQADLLVQLLWEKIHIWPGITMQRAVLLIGCTALHFSHSPWSLKLYGCLCQRHSPIATNGSHGHCISVSAERLLVHRDPAVWFCWGWWSQGQFIP
jgi:hypothetical protein